MTYNKHVDFTSLNCLGHLHCFQESNPIYTFYSSNSDQDVISELKTAQKPKINIKNHLSTPGSVRLQGGRSKLDGKVEVYLGGAWGSVCGDGWGDEDAAVACGQLGRG